MYADLARWKWNWQHYNKNISILFTHFVYPSLRHIRRSYFYIMNTYFGFFFILFDFFLTPIDIRQGQ